MTKIQKLIIAMMIALAILIGVVATDFWLLWLPITHGEEYPQKVATLFVAFSAFVTLFVVYAAFDATTQSNRREQKHREDEIDRRHKKEALEDIKNWATLGYTTFYNYLREEKEGKHLLSDSTIATNFSSIFVQEDAICFKAEEFGNDFSKRIKKSRDLFKAYRKNSLKWTDSKRQKIQEHLVTNYLLAINAAIIKQTELKL